MSTEFILQGKVMWSYDYELMDYTPEQKLMTGIISFSGPLHNHNGFIALTDETILIEGNDEHGNADLVISLISINEIYLGYDEVYNATSAKNAGLFWQPLRLEYLTNQNQLKKMYLIIDYNGLYTYNKKWYETLMTMCN